MSETNGVETNPVERIVMPDHNIIYLIPDGDGGANWCDDPAPSIGMEASDAIKYVREDQIETLKTERSALISALDELLFLKHIKDNAGKTEQYIERQPGAWLAAMQVLDALEA